MGDQDRDGAGQAPRDPEAPAELPPAPSDSTSRPRDWTPRQPATTGPALGTPPMPDLEPLEQDDAPDAPAFAPAAETRRQPRKSLLRRLLFWLLKAILLFVAISFGMTVIYKFVPPPITWTQIGDVFSGHGVTKRWMPLSRIDPDMPRAAIAAEDARFCMHHGFDFTAIEQAYARNQKGGRIRGGSTISQQTAKNVFLFQGGGYLRKALEAYFTVLIENIWGKRRIMEVYLNVAETGIGTYGVNAGAMRYFKHDASQLSPREAAQIAAVLPLPKKRAGIDPRGFTRRYGNAITARIGTVRGDGLDGCIR